MKAHMHFVHVAQHKSLPPSLQTVQFELFQAQVVRDETFGQPCGLIHPAELPYLTCEAALDTL